MLNISPNTEVDLEKYKPDLSIDLRKQARELAERLKRYGVKGEKYGSKKILNALTEKFPKESSDFKVPSRSSVENWIRDILYEADEPAYLPDAPPRQWRSYISRLSLISEFWFERPLTGREAIVAEYVGNEFQDPFGEQVDLIPQLAIIRDIAKCESMKDRTLVEAYEHLFTYAPWKLGSNFYLENLNLAALGFPDMLRQIPLLWDFILIASESGNYKEVSPVFEDALAQLGLPYRNFYFNPEEDHIEGLLREFYGDLAKGKCNWTAILQSRDKAYDEELRTLEQQLTELESEAARATDEDLDFIRNQISTKKEEWKHIAIVPFKEDTDG